MYALARKDDARQACCCRFHTLERDAMRSKVHKQAFSGLAMLAMLVVCALLQPATRLLFVCTSRFVSELLSLHTASA